MSIKHESIDVRVSRRILWFGSEAYPLHNITRTNTLKLVPNRGAAIKNYVVTVVLVLVVVAVVASAAPTAAGILVFAGALAWIAAKTIRLVEFLNLRLYELVIETASGSHQGLISDNRDVVGNLALRITDAVNNPTAEFQMRVDNFHVGDNIAMTGDHSVGKVR